MPSSFLYTTLFIQVSCVMCLMWLFRQQMSWRLNALISSAFVTVPIARYEPLSDVGLFFLFDIVVLVLFARRLFLGDFGIGTISWKFSFPVFLLLLIYSPIGFFFVDNEFLPFHSLLLLNMLCRSLVIVMAMVLLESELTEQNSLAVIRLFVAHFLVLFALGTLQYVAGVDFVIYERIHDTERQVDVLLSGDKKIFIGLGFLGLFRGAVSHMAVAGMFWCMLLALHPRARQREGYALDLFLLFAIICVAGSLSRIGAIALAAVTLLAMAFNARFRTCALLYGAVALVLLFAYDLVSIMGNVADILTGRFDVEQLSGGSGSGGTRIESALALYANIRDDWKPWVIGLGGFNPISTYKNYRVYGMHSDYLEILVRHGLIVGGGYLIILAVGAFRLMKGMFSKMDMNRALSRSFSILLVGIMLLAMTQGALTFNGSAGYLASAQTWLAIVFVTLARNFPAQTESVEP